MTGPEQPSPKLLDRWWVQLLVALWILAVLTFYFRNQVLQLLSIAGRHPSAP